MPHYLNLNKIKQVFLGSVFLILVGTFSSLGRASSTFQEELPLFDYFTLQTCKEDIVSQFHKKGFIALRSVPGFIEAYQDFLEVARTFVALDAEEQAKYTPSKGANNLGWSRGIEKFNNEVDTYKGSYYAYLPEGSSPNIWPDIPHFRERYTALAEIILKTGNEILPLLRINVETYGVGRMLHYSTVSKENDNPYDLWCGEHRDHGLFTGLCPEFYYKNGQKVSKPKDSGLYILDKEISPPEDVLMFQIGEMAELLTQGRVQATRHYVKKAYDGHERFTFALFFASTRSLPVPPQNDARVLQKYQDRYIEGMTTEDWHQRSLSKYEKN